MALFPETFDNSPCMKSPSPKLRSWTGRSSAWHSGWDCKALSSGQKATTAIHVLIDWQEPEKCCSHPNKLSCQSELANSWDGLKNHLRKRPAAISWSWAPNEVSHIHCDNYLDTCALKWTCQHWQFKRMEEAFEKKLTKLKGLVSGCQRAIWRAKCLVCCWIPV